MRIQAINTQINYTKPSFKSRFLVDVGGSVGENSLKTLLIKNKSDETLFKMKDVVNNQGERVYANAQDFLRKLAKKMAICYQKGIENNPQEKVVKEAVFFMPGTVFANTLLYADNIRTPEGKGMSDIDFNLLPQYLKEAGIKLAKNFKLGVFQDSMGSGLAIAKKLFDKGLLPEGSHYAVVITGGGCGVANIRNIKDGEFIKDNIAMIDATGSSYFTNERGLVKIAHAGASASKLIDAFCKNMGMRKDEVDDIVKCGIGQVVTSEVFRIPQNAQGAKLKELLLSVKGSVPADADKPNGELVYKNMYILHDENNLKVADEFHFIFEEARKAAISDYTDSIAKFAVMKENESANGLIVTGPLAFALDKALIKHEDSSISKMITQKVFARYNTHELDKISESNKFRVICNPEFSLSDNTEARGLAFDAKLAGNSRSNWLFLNFDK